MGLRDASASKKDMAGESANYAPKKRFQKSKALVFAQFRSKNLNKTSLFS